MQNPYSIPRFLTGYQDAYMYSPHDYTRWAVTDLLQGTGFSLKVKFFSSLAMSGGTIWTESQKKDSNMKFLIRN